jgi:hypothetical protein
MTILMSALFWPKISAYLTFTGVRSGLIAGYCRNGLVGNLRVDLLNSECGKEIHNIQFIRKLILA